MGRSRTGGGSERLASTSESSVDGTLLLSARPLRTSVRHLPLGMASHARPTQGTKFSLLTVHLRSLFNFPISGNYDRLAFSPYFIFKDLITIFLFLIIISFFVFFLPNVLGDSENYVVAAPITITRCTLCVSPSATAVPSKPGRHPHCRPTGIKMRLARRSLPGSHSWRRCGTRDQGSGAVILRPKRSCPTALRNVPLVAPFSAGIIAQRTEISLLTFSRAAGSAAPIFPSSDGRRWVSREEEERGRPHGARASGGPADAPLAAATGGSTVRVVRRQVVGCAQQPKSSSWPRRLVSAEWQTARAGTDPLPEAGVVFGGLVWW